MIDIKSFLMQCARVWQILKKPSVEEYRVISKVAGAGLLIIGFLGFAVALIVHLLPM